MRTLIFTTALFTLTACDDPQSIAVHGEDASCTDATDQPPHESARPDSPGPHSTEEPLPSDPVTPRIHDVSVSIESDETAGDDILVEFEIADLGTGAVHIVRAAQMTIELVRDGQTLVAMEADILQLREAAQAGLSCGSAIDTSYEVVFADSTVLDAAARDGSALDHAAAMEIALATHPELADLLSASDQAPLNCEDDCNLAGAIGGSAAGAGGAAWCCIGSVGVACIPCAAGAGAAGAAIGGLLSAGCTGLFC